MSKNGGKIVAVQDATQSMRGVSNGNGHAPVVSDPNEFPVPLEGVITVQLDTGRVVEMVIGELSMLYEAGEIPNELTPIAARVLMALAPSNERERERHYTERLRLARWLVERVTMGKLPVSRLYHDEIWQIYNMANQPAAAMSNFRRQQARHVGLVSELQDVGTDTEPEIARAALA